MIPPSLAVKGEFDTSPPVDMCLNEPEFLLLAVMASTPPSAPDGWSIVVVVDLGENTGGTVAIPAVDGFGVEREVETVERMVCFSCQL